MLNLRTAIPCGMIISELISNSLKHAFPDTTTNRNAYGSRKKPQKFIIKISINKGKMLKSGKIRTSPKGWVYLNICDNGIGLPKNLKLQNSDSLGLRLVKLMVEQLEGQMRMDHENGACFKINFKEQ
jgi:two-component sensor histidine kinase